MIPLKQAEGWAARIAAELRPWCEAVEVAGSIRRRRPEVGDIDLVALPKVGGADAIRNRMTRRAAEVLANGEQNVRVRLANGVQVEVYLARQEEQDLLYTTPSNWGSLLVCRTGSREFNIGLARRALQLGMRWDPYQGVFSGGGHLLAGATEAEVFKALDVTAVPPERREGSWWGRE